MPRGNCGVKAGEGVQRCVHGPRAAPPDTLCCLDVLQTRAVGYTAADLKGTASHRPVASSLNSMQLHSTAAHVNIAQQHCSTCVREPKFLRYPELPRAWAHGCHESARPNPCCMPRVMCHTCDHDVCVQPRQYSVPPDDAACGPLLQTACKPALLHAHSPQLRPRPLLRLPAPTAPPPPQCAWLYHALPCRTAAPQLHCQAQVGC